jgi:hypothetical protein
MVKALYNSQMKKQPLFIGKIINKFKNQNAANYMKGKYIYIEYIVDPIPALNKTKV